MGKPRPGGKTGQWIGSSTVRACWNSVSVLGTSGFWEETMIVPTQEMMIRQGQEVVSVLALRLSDHFREVVAV